MHLRRFLVAVLLLIAREAHAADVPTFHVNPEDITNIVLDATTGDPWIFSVTLTKTKLKEYDAFTSLHIGEQVALKIAGTEIYRPRISAPIRENPITFRMYEKEKYLAILEAIPCEPIQHKRE